MAKKEEVLFEDNKKTVEQVAIAIAHRMLRKAVEEFCQEFDIKEFKINYNDPTPKKDI